MGLTELIIALIFGAIGFTIAWFMARPRQSRLEERNEILTTAKEEAERKLEEETDRANRAKNELATVEANFLNLK